MITWKDTLSFEKHTYSTASTEQALKIKQVERDEILMLVDDYLKKGGKITVLRQGQRVTPVSPY